MTTANTDKRFLRSRAAALDAAVDIIATRGVEDVTHQNVAEAAGLGRATMYRHWPTRTELIVDTLTNAVPVITVEDLPDDIAVGARIEHRLRLLRDRLWSNLAPSLITLIAQGDYHDALAGIRGRIMQPALEALIDDIASQSDDDLARHRANALVGSLFLDRFVLNHHTTDGDIDRSVRATGLGSA